MNRKALKERRDELQRQIDGMLATAQTENRAMTEEETAAFDAAEAEMHSIDATLDREERARALEREPGAGS